MISIDDLKQKKKALEQKQVEIRAEEKFLAEERQRLTKKLHELGFKNLNEAREALDKKRAEIQEKEVQLSEMLDTLENSDVKQGNKPQEVQWVSDSPVLMSIDDL